jgi:hypothetical protein
MLAGVVFIADELVHLTNPIPFLDVAFVVAMLLVLVGILGFHALQKGSYGLMGLSGFYAVVAGIAGQVVGLAFLLSGSTSLLWLVSAAAFVLMVGFVLYGFATFRAGALPRWCGAALIVTFPLAFVFGMYAYFWLGFIWLALGYVLWTRRRVATEQSTRAR